MARKKQEIALQQMIETQEEWEEVMAKEGLIAVEVYQEWAGPSRAMLNVFKDCLVKVEHDKMLKLVAAKTDTIDSLERYRGKCQPCFLFYAGGVLVALVRGANAPLLFKTVIEELKKEHQVMEGQKERVEIRDPLFAHLDTDKSTMEDMEDGGEEEPEMVPKEVTVALIKPDVVEKGQADEVIEKMKESGIEILKNEERKLTEEEAKDFYSHLKDEPFFEGLIGFMCSGPSRVLLLSKPDTGKGIIDEWRELIGPTKVEEAKENAPNSLRAQYGTENMYNALHGSDSHQSAAKELAFFFPEYQVPTVAKPGARGAPARMAQRGVQRTLALIRPDALVEKKDEILKKIEEAGFEIALQKEIQLNKEQAEGFYEEHREQPYFEELIERMTSGPVLALGLARNDAVDEWRKLLGPTKATEAKEQQPNSLRAQFSIEGTDVNMIHGSDSTAQAQKELNFFFPVQQTVAVIKPDAYENKDVILDKIKEAGFHVAARKETTLTPDIANMLYKHNEGQEYYNDLIDHMTSGPTLFMVLSKEDAVENWRGVIGPTDPAEAKETAPDSIRAQFGTDVKANAVHGPETEENAKLVIGEIFGDLKTKSDGTVDQEGSALKEGVDVEQPSKSDEETAGEEEAGEPAAGEAAPEGEKTEGEQSGGEAEQSAAESGQGQPEEASAADEKEAEAATNQDGTAEEAKPVEGDDKPAQASEGSEAKPAEESASTEEAKPAEEDETIPAEGAEATPAEGAEATPAEGAEATPAEGAEATPAEGAEATPAEGAEATPAEGAEATPAEGAEATPAEGAEATPAEGAEATPAEGAEATPAEGAEATPAEESAEAPKLEDSESEYTEEYSDEEPEATEQQSEEAAATEQQSEEAAAMQQTTTADAKPPTEE